MAWAERALASLARGRLLGPRRHYVLPLPLQGYLANEKQCPPLGPPCGPKQSPAVGS